MQMLDSVQGQRIIFDLFLVCCCAEFFYLCCTRAFFWSDIVFEESSARMYRLLLRAQCELEHAHAICTTAW